MKIELTKEFLETEYCDKFKSVKTITNETGWSHKYITAQMRKFGIQRRNTGNSKLLQLKNKKFGKLTPIEPFHINKTYYWKCLCDCGNFTNAITSHLIRGLTTHCGCSHGQSGKNNSGWKGYEDIPHIIWARICKNTDRKSRKLELNITIEYIWNVFIKQDRKCALSGAPIYFKCGRQKQTASLDRIDSNKGYTIGNVQWVHKDVNKMKQNINEKDFINWCNKISINRNNNYDIGY